MGNVYIFKVIWNILRPFGIFCGHWVCFSEFWYVVPVQIWQPCSSSRVEKYEKINKCEKIRRSLLSPVKIIRAKIILIFTYFVDHHFRILSAARLGTVIQTDVAWRRTQCYSHGAKIA
jgi:hypothetical protein